ncbi:MAG: hypothetical protein J6K32_07480 [Clostridia bacterium]|nr:hypothetical protein [Clostridia bacterium]
MDKKPETKQVDEAMVDQIIEEAEIERRGFKEQIYEKLRMPLWLLDTIIVLLVAAFIAILIFGRG